MKITKIILIFITLFSYEYSIKAQKLNVFSSQMDTLVLETKKIKGYGMFPAGAGKLYFKDTVERYDYTVIFPRDISQIKLTTHHIDIKPFEFEWCKKGEFNKTELLKSVLDNKIDTLNLPTKRDNTIAIMSGRKGAELVFIVDENNNKDFRDDSIRIYHKMDWKSTKLIKCKYQVYDGNKMINDSTWVNIGTLGGDELWFFVSNHLETNFSIDNESYQIGIVDEHSSFCFDDPIFALTAQNGVEKDTLLKTELLQKGEYVKLKNTYYQFADISNDGRYITLIKENDFNSKIGTQVGMIAPNFKCKTTTGEFIDSNNIKDKILLANISGCTSTSYDKYNQLLIAYSDKIYILGIESGVSKKIKGKLIDVEDEYNKGLYEKYRRAYSCYDCYLINTDGRIIDKFDIFDWEKNLQGLKK